MGDDEALTAHQLQSLSQRLQACVSSRNIVDVAAVLGIDTAPGREPHAIARDVVHTMFQDRGAGRLGRWGSGVLPLPTVTATVSKAGT